MKKIISLFLVFVMLAAMTSFPVSADEIKTHTGEIWAEDDFESDEMNTDIWEKITGFRSENGVLCSRGYSLIHVLASLDTHAEFNISIDVRIVDVGDEKGRVGFTYGGNQVVFFWMDVKENLFWLEGAEDVDGNDKEWRSEVPIEIGEDAEFVKIGLHVEKGKIKAYVNGECVIEHEDKLIGDIPSYVMLVNYNDYAEWDNFVVASPDCDIFRVPEKESAGIWAKDEFEIEGPLDGGILKAEDEELDDYYTKNGVLCLRSKTVARYVHPRILKKFNVSVDLRVVDAEQDDGRAGILCRSGMMFHFYFDAKEGKFVLENDSGIIVKEWYPSTPIKTGDEAEFVNIGLHVEKGRMEAYVNGEFVMELEYEYIDDMRNIALYSDCGYTEWDNFVVASGDTNEIFRAPEKVEIKDDVESAGIWAKDEFKIEGSLDGGILEAEDKELDNYYIKNGVLCLGTGVLAQYVHPRILKKFNVSVDLRVVDIGQSIGRAGILCRSGMMFHFYFDVKEGKFVLENDSGIIVKEWYPSTPIKTGDEAEFVNIGLHVEKGRMEAYVNGEFVMELEYEYIDDMRNIALYSYCGYTEWDNFVVASSDTNEIFRDPVYSIIYGDVDGDGEIGTKDVILLMQHNAEWSSAKGVGVGADVNGDGTIDTQDVILLMQYNAKRNVTLGPKK